MILLPVPEYMIGAVLRYEASGGISSPSKRSSPYGIVLDDRQIVTLADADDVFAALLRQRSAGGILKVRNEVEKLRERIGAIEHALERFRNRAVFVGIDRQIARLIGIERLNRSEVRWISSTT